MKHFYTIFELEELARQQREREQAGPPPIVDDPKQTVMWDDVGLNLPQPTSRRRRRNEPSLFDGLKEAG